MNFEQGLSDGPEPRWILSEIEIRKYLRRADFVFTEDYFLEVLRAPRNKMNEYWSLVALRGLGTSKCIPFLKEALYSRHQDTAVVAMVALAYVAEGEATQVYLDALTGTWYRNKWAALFALQTTCDPQSFPRMLAWVKKKRREIKCGRMNYQQALELALYLFRLGKVLPESEALLRELTPELSAIFQNSHHKAPNFERGVVVRRTLSATASTSQN